MQLICVDEQHFAKLRGKGGVYVDKTKAMYDLFKDGTYFFIARPRRFGKSLLCSTLAELFAGNRNLFKNTWIDGSDWEWKKHPVLHFDMTNAISGNGDASITHKKLLLMTAQKASEYGVEITNINDPASALQQLVEKIHAKTGEQVVVIIDEYDKPLLDAIDKTDKYPAIHEELRVFYSPLKALSDKLRLVFMTGVFKFAKTSIFSGLNNLHDLTFNPRAAHVVGYTEQEIRTVFAEHLEAFALKNKLSTVDMMAVLQSQYNGYKFGVDVTTGDLSEGVYNPFGLNYVFQEQQQLAQWFASGSPTALIKKLARDQFADIEPQNLAFDFRVLENSCNPDNITGLSMLYYAGYLSLKNYTKSFGGDEITLDFPNVEVGQSFSKLLLPLITKTDDNRIRAAVKALGKTLFYGKLDELHDLLNHILAQIPYGLHGARAASTPTADNNSNPAESAEEEARIDFTAREHYYQTVFHLLLAAAGFVVSPEDMTNRGRIDITVILPKTVYLFELKMNQPAAVAIQQIKDRDYATKYRTPGCQIYAIGIALSDQKRTVEEVIWEQL